MLKMIFFKAIHGLSAILVGMSIAAILEYGPSNLTVAMIVLSIMDVVLSTCLLCKITAEVAEHNAQKLAA